nr:hypothetical protein CFP56_62969 [Quercus suber]
MGFAYLLRTKAAIAAFRRRFNIPLDVNAKFCPEGNVKRFLVDLILLRTLSFYGLSPNQCLPNFYRIVNSVIRLNNLYGLGLNHHDIKFMYSICDGLKTGYYLKIHDPTVRLISCLLGSNRNSTGELVKVQDLNFVLCSNIFMHYDRQLRASHLILDYVPSYTSYRDSRPTLIVGRTLLSYIDIRLPEFLPKGLTVGEA